MRLELRDISVRFGGFRAVDGVSLAIEPGTLTGIIGPNGAGKSTLFSMVTGFLQHGEGTVLLGDAELSRDAPFDRARRGMVRTFQVPREFAHLTVRENLMAAAPGQSGENLIDLFFRPGKVRAEEEAIRREAEETIDFLKLRAVADAAAGRLSGGQKKLLELGRVLMTKPKLILLDEPFAGVNPVLIEELSGHIRALNRRGIGFVIIEHDLSALSRLVSMLHVMDQGRLMASGTPAEVLARKDVREAYLGGAA
ncbi:MAG: ABC transporter ATP-binding protein [Methylobacterium sp.]|nr:ABC transporter ATP-binding protein [Methylobacterium sp.]MCA3607128.1 ABC transporter ATP-binding protein [Methylobacterium sp.]MCA3607951.1 ABC transporter ATP-binding protein [Methylobacterium sp.]MCA3613178.1 ABC transporter ATP-binding protein [Methylobacterium sp.]MCA3617330.1 ABC transporter ATP-binding protein [Methylobacterium sp.]